MQTITTTGGYMIPTTSPTNIPNVSIPNPDMAAYFQKRKNKELENEIGVICQEELFGDK